ncbi:hypothetical protein [Actinoplanes rectilineatus]|uniref:hypothetical protein n=1 Tax=Actinoplanes rectilineatus TaxID=113571 RepID=UPI0007C879C3|nr:hypothetical protein [Actinoplanes rectilineatus]
MRTPTVAVVAVAALAAGCGTDPEARAPATPALSWSGAAPSPSTSSGVRVSTPSPAAGTPAAPRTTTPSRISEGWEITVYYTAVERFHNDEDEQVTGCLTLDCSHGDDDLGSYPSGFVQAVQDEGTGQTTSGKYLNWSYDIGYWLDTEPRSSDGTTLQPFVSAAADPNVLPHGTRFTIADCGTQEDGSAPPDTVCDRLSQASWLITDEFTPGLGGNHHIDAYIGPETGPGFTDSDWYLTLVDATLHR